MSQRNNDQSNSNLKNGKTKRTKPDHITWDEEAIAEHDKERGTRQKIDEPPTPYHYFDEEGNEVNASYFPSSSSSSTSVSSDIIDAKGKTKDRSMDTMIEDSRQYCDSIVTLRNTVVEQTSTRNTKSSDIPIQKQVLDPNNLNDFASKLQEVSKAGPGIAIKDENGEEYIPPLRSQNEKKAFSSKRQQHYDEFLKMKEYKEKLAKGLLDEEDEDEDEEEA